VHEDVALGIDQFSKVPSFALTLAALPPLAVAAVVVVIVVAPAVIATAVGDHGPVEDKAEHL
jgi:hypothetical protein